MNFFIKTGYNIIFVIILLIVSVFFTYIAYRNTTVQNPQKSILRILRFTSVFLVLYLLLSPFLYIIKSYVSKPLNIILVDNSLSMKIGNKISDEKKYLAENIKHYFADNTENIVFSFSNGLTQQINNPEIDSIKFEGINNSETNVSQALEEIVKRFPDRNIAAINIISDGIFNSGGNPVNQGKLTGAAFNYYLIGDTIQQKDIVLDAINFNKNVYIESSTPVIATLSSYGYNKPVNVNLYEDNSLIDTKIINTNKNESKYKVEFNVSSPVESIKKYKIEVEPQSDEITTQNNSEEFIIKFLNNKLRILVLSGGPGADFAYLAQEIKKINNIEARFLTQKSANEFYEGAPDNFNDYQVFILSDFPTSVTNPGIITGLKEKLSKRNSSLFFIAGRNTDYEKLSLIDEFLPFSTSASNISEIRSSVYSVTNLNEEFKNFKSLNSVNSFPEVYRTSSSISMKPQTETVLLFSNNHDPALMISSTNTNRSAAILFYGFYKWRLNPNSTNSDQVFNSILSGTILSITDKEKTNKFFIETTKQIYSPYEDVIFNATISDPETSLSGKIRIRIYNDKYDKEIELEKKENSNFYGKEKITDAGEYTYVAELITNGTVLEKTVNKFIIGDDKKEYRETRSDAGVLNQLASIKGGMKFNNLRGNEIEKVIESSGKNSSEIKEYNIKDYFNRNIYYLLIIIILLSAEWVLRKRNNLP